MICKTCIYETNEIFFTCPRCGGEMTTSQNNNDPIEYETPFIEPNNTNLNVQLEQNNQYNNDYSEPINNYQNQPINNKYTSRLHKGYSSNMSESFKGFGSSFSINKNVSFCKWRRIQSYINNSIIYFFGTFGVNTFRTI